MWVGVVGGGEVVSADLAPFVDAVPYPEFVAGCAGHGVPVELHVVFRHLRGQGGRGQRRGSS